MLFAHKNSLCVQQQGFTTIIMHAFFKSSARENMFTFETAFPQLAKVLIESNGLMHRNTPFTVFWFQILGLNQ